MGVLPEGLQAEELPALELAEELPDVAAELVAGVGLDGAPEWAAAAADDGGLLVVRLPIGSGGVMAAMGASGPAAVASDGLAPAVGLTRSRGVPLAPFLDRVGKLGVW